MGNIGDTIATAIPVVGAGGSGYATDIDSFLTEVKARLEAKLPKSSIAAGSLDLANNALQNASYITLYNMLSAPTTPVGSLQAYNGDLYWVSGAGTVQLTVGGLINSAVNGGITGNYGGANPAQFRFVDADQEFYAYDDFGAGAWANLWARNVDIAAGASSAFRCRLAYGGAGSYTLTLPPAAPATKKILSMDSSGNVTAAGDVNTRINMPFALGTFQSAAGVVTTTAGTAVYNIPINSDVYYPIVYFPCSWQLNAVEMHFAFGGGTTNPGFTLYRSTSLFANTAQATTTTYPVDPTAGKVATVTLNTPAVLDNNNHWMVRITTNGTTNINVKGLSLNVTAI
jgi:hypothetical protein